MPLTKRSLVSYPFKTNGYLVFILKTVKINRSRNGLKKLERVQPYLQGINISRETIF